VSLIAVPPWGRHRISTQLQWPRKLVVRIHFRWLKGKRDGHKSAAHKFKPLSFLIESPSQACNLIADLPFLLLSTGLKAGYSAKDKTGSRSSCRSILPSSARPNCHKATSFLACRRAKQSRTALFKSNLLFRPECIFESCLSGGWPSMPG
jgi:hypothetical protein